MKNILYTIILSFLFSSGVFADWEAGVDAYQAGDYATALKEFRPLAEQGLAEAQFNLGWMYVKGLGVTQDYKEAVKWFRLAAEQGYTFAQQDLGKMYEKGEGVIQDNVIAYMWYSIAIFSGDEVHAGLVRYDINRIESKMTPEQILKANKLTREYIKKSR